MTHVMLEYLIPLTSTNSAARCRLVETGDTMRYTRDANELQLTSDKVVS